MLEDTIKQNARELGFNLVGIAPATTPSHYTKYIEWLQNGYNADMHYLEDHIDLKKHPSCLLDNAQSIIMVGLNYAQPMPTHRDEDEEPCASIAMYAWGKDYHKIIKRKLKSLSAKITELCPDVKGRICVDSAPLMERDFAQSAGIGWFGKNTCIINAQFGSWFVLGALILDIEMQFDEPAKGHCGTCRKCIDSCPTGAIIKPYVIDARKCISYHTIENRGDIPADIAEKVGGWIFGCDICQQACPFNKLNPKQPKRFAPTTEAGFKPMPMSVSPPFSTLLKMTNAEFDAWYSGSPIKRTKYDGMKRNILIAYNTTKSKLKR